MHFVAALVVRHFWGVPNPRDDGIAKSKHAPYGTSFNLACNKYAYCRPKIVSPFVLRIAKTLVPF